MFTMSCWIIGQHGYCLQNRKPLFYVGRIFFVVLVLSTVSFNHPTKILYLQRFFPWKVWSFWLCRLARQNHGLLDMTVQRLGEELSKGNVGYPWQGTLAAVPRILPHLALYNHYIIHILVVYVGIYVGYSPKGTQLFHLKLFSGWPEMATFCAFNLPNWTHWCFR